MPLSKVSIFKGLDVKTNLLGRDQDRAADCDNVYVNTSDELRNRPFFSQYTFTSLPGPLRGLQTASFKSYSGMTGYKYVGPYNRYMLAYISGSDTVVGNPASTRGEVLRINSLPAAGSVLQESATDPYTENSTGKNFRRMKAQYNLLAHRMGAPFLAHIPSKGVNYEDVQYFLGIFGLWKTDGLVTMRAGNGYGASTISAAGGGSPRYYRTFISHFDFSGQWVHGDYHEQLITNGQGAKTCKYSFTSVDNNQNLAGGLFDSAYVLSTGAAYNNADPALATELVVNSTVNRIEVGDYLTVYGATRTAISRNEKEIYKIRVKAKTGTTVTFDVTDCYAADLEMGGGFKKVIYPYIVSEGHFIPNGSINFGETYVCNSNYIMTTYASATATSGYKFVGIGVIDPDEQSSHRITTDVMDGASSANQYYPYGVLPRYYPFTFAFEDCYDEARVKGLLPHTTLAQSTDEAAEASGTDFLFLARHNNIMLAATEKYIYFSDASSVGSTIENFDPRDFFLVGSMDEGPIRGIFANDEYIIVHREKNSHYVTGNLLTGSFRSTALNTDKFGAVSHWAQNDILAQDFFVSKKGAHGISRGGTLTDFGDLVSPIIKNEKTATFGTFPRLSTEIPLINCADDDLKNHIYTFYEAGATTSKVLLFNYRIKEWFKWTLPLAFNKVGTRIVGGAAGWEGLLWTSNGTSLWVENTSTSAPDAAFVEGFWNSVFRNEGVPSIEKRYTYLKLFSLDHDSISSIVNVKCRYDWESSALIDQGDLHLPNTEVTPPQGFELMDLTDRNCYSLQFRVGSLGYMNLQGFELETNLVQDEVTR